MKRLISNYTFDASLKQIVLTDYSSIDLESLLLITNVEDNLIIYNFASSGKGGTISGNVITLDYDTTSMSDTDSLQIFIEDGDLPATNEVLELNNLLLKQLIKITESLSIVDTAQRQRVAVEVMPATVNVGGTVAVSTVGSLGGTVTINGNNSNIKPVDFANNSVYELNTASTFSRYVGVPDVWRTIDIARQAYQLGIRSNLSFQ